MTAPELWLLLDEHVGLAVVDGLRDRGVDAVSVGDLGMRGAPDDRVLERAAREGRIVVTRNYRDFAILVEAHVRRGTSFTGVLFLSPSIAPADVGAHLRALSGWVQRHAGRPNPVADGYGWLGPA